MGKTYEEQKALAERLVAAKAHITIGARYVHYKGADKIYKVTGLAVNEADNVITVVYQAQYGARLTFLRPLDVWLETVDWEGAAVARFSKL